jgi:hypothetical protein
MDEEALMRAMADILRAQRDRAASEARDARRVDELTAFLCETEVHLASKPGDDELAELMQWVARSRRLARKSLELAAGLS